METFKKPNGKTDEILQNHRLNLEDICLIFSAPRIRSSKLKQQKLDDHLFVFFVI